MPAPAIAEYSQDSQIEFIREYDRVFSRKANKSIDFFEWNHLLNEDVVEINDLKQFSSVDIGPTSTVIIEVAKTFSCDLLHIENGIKESEFILSLQDNWDSEGAIKPPSYVYHTAVDFLRKYCTYVKSEFGVEVHAPEISPLNDGSIDLNWETENGNLLINVKNSIDKIGYYYGEMYRNGNKIFDVNGKLFLNETVDSFASWFLYLSKME